MKQPITAIHIDWQRSFILFIFFVNNGLKSTHDKEEFDKGQLIIALQLPRTWIVEIVWLDNK